MNKEKAEEKFTEMIIKKGGIKQHCVTYDRGHYYWCFWLSSGEQLFWTNLSKENQIKLGIKESVENE